MKHNGHTCYVDNGYLLVSCLMEEEGTYDEISDKVLRDLALHREKTYEESRIMIRVDSIAAVYDALTPNRSFIELKNGYQHRIKASFDELRNILITA
jgi:hypothetical protein